MDHYTLSPQQYDMAFLVSLDLSDDEIAKELHVELITVRKTLEAARKRIGVRTRVGLAVAIITRDIVVLDRRTQGLRGLSRHGGAR